MPIIYIFLIHFMEVNNGYFRSNSPEHMAMVLQIEGSATPEAKIKNVNHYLDMYRGGGASEETEAGSQPPGVYKYLVEHKKSAEAEIVLTKLRDAHRGVSDELIPGALTA